MRRPTRNRAPGGAGFAKAKPAQASEGGGDARRTSGLPSAMGLDGPRIRAQGNGPPKDLRVTPPARTMGLPASAKLTKNSAD